MRVLLVDPDYRSAFSRRSKKSAKKREIRPDDNALLYPPLGLMKLARFHKDRGDEVGFVHGCSSSLAQDSPNTGGDVRPLDRVYISTVFTFHFNEIVKTINFYLEAVGGTKSKIYVGGMAASLMKKEISIETGVVPVDGLLTDSEKIGFDCGTNIDRTNPDYSILDPTIYAINSTYYAYTTRGCPRKCDWCAVPTLEPNYIRYVDIAEQIKALRDAYGDKPVLRLMDNNVLASTELANIVSDLERLGYKRGDVTSETNRRKRVVDFNQGLDARLLTEAKMKLLSSLNIQPMRIAFDSADEEDIYVAAIKRAREYGVFEFSNYMLYGFKDTPKDLYDRILVNIKLNDEVYGKDKSSRGREGTIYSYPMRYAAISSSDGPGMNRQRNFISTEMIQSKCEWPNLTWNRKFLRNLDVIKGATHGAISPTPTLARRAVGRNYNEFIANLYMPEELLRYRNKYEETVYPDEPPREPGDGTIEKFRTFLWGLLEQGTDRLHLFHGTVSENSISRVREVMNSTKDKEIHKWLKWYLKRDSTTKKPKSQLEDT